MRANQEKPPNAAGQSRQECGSDTRSRAFKGGLTTCFRASLIRSTFDLGTLSELAFRAFDGGEKNILNDNLSYERLVYYSSRLKQNAPLQPVVGRHLYGVVPRLHDSAISLG